MTLTFVTGGARSGKSGYALRLAAAAGTPVALIATAEARDDEMRERIEAAPARAPGGLAHRRGAARSRRRAARPRARRVRDRRLPLALGLEPARGRRDAAAIEQRAAEAAGLAAAPCGRLRRRVERGGHGDRPDQRAGALVPGRARPRQRDLGRGRRRRAARRRRDACCGWSGHERACWSARSPRSSSPMPRRARRCRRRLDQKTKPRGSLGGLERLAVRIAGIQRTATPALGTPVVVVCAADHGVAAEGVSAFPSSVTAQMVANYAAGGAAVSVLARRAGARLVVVDCGVAEPLPVPGVLDRRLGAGTASMLQRPGDDARAGDPGARDGHRARRRGARGRRGRRARRDGHRQLHGGGGALLRPRGRDARAGLRPRHGPRRRGAGAQARRRHARARRSTSPDSTRSPVRRAGGRRADSSSACSPASRWEPPAVASRARRRLPRILGGARRGRAGAGAAGLADRRAPLVRARPPHRARRSSGCTRCSTSSSASARAAARRSRCRCSAPRSRSSTRWRRSRPRASTTAAPDGGGRPRGAARVRRRRHAPDARAARHARRRSTRPTWPARWPGSRSSASALGGAVALAARGLEGRLDDGPAAVLIVAGLGARDRRHPPRRPRRLGRRARRRRPRAAARDHARLAARLVRRARARARRRAQDRARRRGAGARPPPLADRDPGRRPRGRLGPERGAAVRARARARAPRS